MKIRMAIFTVLLTISILVGTEVIGVASANPTIPKGYDDGIEKPAILIKSPLNNEVLNSTSNVRLAFVVKYPPSWKWIHIDNYTIGQIDSLDVIIDGVKSNHFVNSYSCSDPNYNFTDFSINLKTLDAGSHLANITVYSHSYSLGYTVGLNDNSFPPLETHMGTMYSFPITVNKTVNFAITQQMLPSPTPTASQSIPTINAASKLPLESNPSVVYGIITIVIVILAVAGSLVYFKRRRGKT